MPALETPAALACAGIYLACLESCQPASHASSIPSTDPDLTKEPVLLPMQPRPWWELFGIESHERIWRIVSTLLQFYDQWTDGCKSGSGTSAWTKAAQWHLPLTKAAVREHAHPGGTPTVKNPPL